MTFIPLVSGSAPSVYPYREYYLSSTLGAEFNSQGLSYYSTYSLLPAVGFAGFSTYYIESEQVELAESGYWTVGQQMRVITETSAKIDAKLSQFFNCYLSADKTLEILIYPGYSLQLAVYAEPSRILTLKPAINWMNESIPPGSVTRRLYSFTCHRAGEIIGNWGNF